MYGHVQSCGFTGTSWVIVNQGLFTGGASTPNGKGNEVVPDASTVWTKNPSISIYRCATSDTACLDPATSHPLANWVTVTAPTAGGVTLIGSPYPGMLVFDIGGMQLMLNSNAAQWEGSGPSQDATVGSCSAAWGRTRGSADGFPATIAQQVAFEAANPACAA